MKNLFLSLVLGIICLPVIGQEDIKWMSIEEAEKAMQKESRKIVIDVYTDWCGWCKRMDKTTFKNPVIVRYVNENYYAVKLNAEQKDSIVFMDHTFKYVPQGRRGYHELAAALLQGKMSYPSTVYFDEDLQMIQAIPGYQGPEQFEQIIKYFGENRHKEVSFDEFKESFNSELAQ